MMLQNVGAIAALIGCLWKVWDTQATGLIYLIVFGLISVPVGLATS